MQCAHVKCANEKRAYVPTTGEQCDSEIRAECFPLKVAFTMLWFQAASRVDFLKFAMNVTYKKTF